MLAACLDSCPSVAFSIIAHIAGGILAICFCFSSKISVLMCRGSCQDTLAVH